VEDDTTRREVLEQLREDEPTLQLRIIHLKIATLQDRSKP
jgi:hypothetical protein